MWFRSPLRAWRPPAEALPWCALASVLYAAARLAYPAALVLFSAARGDVALWLLGATLALTFARALVADVISRRVRTSFFARLAVFMEHLPATWPDHTTPVNQLETQLAQGLPWLEAHVSHTLPTLAGSALALAPMALLAVREVGPDVSLLSLLALIVSLGCAAWVARLAGRQGDHAWNAFQRIAVLLERGLRGRVELRAHDLTSLHARTLRAGVQDWVRADRRARFAFALTGWAIPVGMFALGALAAEAVGWDVVPALVRLATQPDGSVVRAGLFLLAASPLLTGASRSLADLSAQRPHLRALDVVCAAQAGATLLPRVALGDASSAIQFERAIFAFRAQDRTLQISADFTWETKSLALVGPNGCGKTTLALALLGAVTPSSGAVKVREGKEWLDAGAIRLAAGYLSQDPYFGQAETVGEAIRFVAPQPEEREVRTLLARLWPGSLEGGDVLLRRTATLSSGERRLIALTRVLLRSSPLLILDEPEANLGASARERVRTVLEEVCKTRRVLLLTHDAGFARLAHQVILFDDAHRALGGSERLAAASAACCADTTETE